MIFTKIELENFGIFRGKHVFNLSPLTSKNFQKPIILFGGKNGAGKTTLFEAVRLCLYGENFNGSKLSKSKYKKELFKRINHTNGGIENNLRTTICVEFEYGRFGHVDTYLIQRSWVCADGKIVSSLEVQQNGKLLRDIDEKQWQDFVMELVPLGVSRLFFFDGEQIQNLAEDEVDNRYLIKSIHSLLGLDLIERLQADLRIYLSKKMKEHSNELANDLSKHEKEKILFEKKLDAHLQERAKLQSLMDRINAEIEDQEHRIALEGGGYASKREQLKVKKQQLEFKIDNCKNEIRKSCAGLLPFALTPNLCNSLRKRLCDEEAYQEKLAARNRIESAAQSLFDEMSSEDFWDDFSFSVKNRKELASKIFLSLRSNVDEDQEQEIVHPMSSVDRKQTLDWIERALNKVPNKLKKLFSNLEEFSRERQEVVTQLYRAPIDEVIHPFVQKINELHSEKGALQEKIRQLDTEISGFRNELKRIEWELDKLMAKKVTSEKRAQIILMTKNVNEILAEFIVRLRKRKIDDLCVSFLECFKWLSNKGDLIEKLEIDSDDFQMALWRIDNKVKISKNQLSAGEKQIFAIAMLWALARESGRPLPFMIDTPLGRLDAMHRERIVEKFFPFASHQVILFSTDTEIDKQLFKMLHPYIARAYHLNYDEKSKSSYASSGYFWKSSECEVKC